MRSITWAIFGAWLTVVLAFYFLWGRRHSRSTARSPAIEDARDDPGRRLLTREGRLVVDRRSRAMLARSLGTDLLVVTVVPDRWPTPVAGNTDREYADWSRAARRRRRGRGQGRARRVTGPTSPRWPVAAGRSVAGTLLQQAEQVDAGMVVVGSGEHGSLGASYPARSATGCCTPPTSPSPWRPGLHPPASTARAPGDVRLPRRRQVAPAAAAHGGRSARTSVPRCGWSHFAVLGRTVYTAGVGNRAEDMVLDRWVSQATAAQEAALEALQKSGDAPAEVEALVASGRTWGAAIDRLDWDRDEVLVLGSSEAGVIERIFLGSNASKIVRHSPVPVIVVP